MPGELRLVEPAPVEAIDAAGKRYAVEHGRNLHLTVRPEAPVQLLFTGHMDTVFGADHPFQALRWLEPGGAQRPRRRRHEGRDRGDARGAEGGRGERRWPSRIGYEVVINSDEEVGSLGSAALIAAAARGQARRADLRALGAARRDAGRRAAGQRQFQLHRHAARSAHAGRNPEDGRNALVAAADLALRLPRRGCATGSSVNPARIDGGGPNNVVPDLAVLRVNMRPRDARRPGRARRR